ncbi:MAG: BON domain-containing protein [Pirellulales bacterium]
MRRFFAGLAIGLATLSPSWAMANDEQIAQEIIERLQTKKEAGELKGFNIDLEVDQGTVWLSGSVANPAQQRMALDIARRVSGVEKVVNQLKVADDSTPAQPVAKPKTATRTSGGSPSLFSSVFAKPVPAAEKVETKAADAEPTPATEAKSDQQLVQDILGQLRVLKQAGQLRGFKLDVQAEDGLVWLSGEVADSNQHKQVIETVRRVAGVKQVVNDLKIKSSATPVKAEGSGVAQTSGEQPVAAAPSAAPNIPGYTAVPVRAAMAPGAFAPYGAAPLAAQGPRVANRPLAFAPSHGGVSPVNAQAAIAGPETPLPAHMPGPNVGVAPARYDHPNMPGYAWPSYASYPNYAAVTYPKQYSPAAWPYIGPFYPYPQVPLGWRKVTLKWDDGWWNLDFKSK